MKATDDAMHATVLRFIRAAAAATILVTLTIAARAATDPGLLRSPYGGEIRALVIGIDAYRHVRPLKGAAADAKDIEGALRTVGVRDVTALIDGAVSRAAVLSAINGLLQRTGPNDVVFISLAGHGAQETDPVRGAHSDGLEDVFLLPDFEDTPAGSKERILGAEFNHFIKEFEARGAHLVFVADTCYGGGMTRDIDPRAQQMSFRHVPAFKLTEDQLQPVSTAADDAATEFDFRRTAFLAAVDNKTMAPEVEIPGIPGLRGALSYAVARAIEGGADYADGRTTVRGLFGAVRQVVYQLSNERQNIVTTAPASEDPNTAVVFEMVRSVTIGTPQATAGAPVPLRSEAAPARDERPIKIAALDGNKASLAALKQQQAPFKIVTPVEYPDLTWDPASHDVIAWGDVVAYGVDPADLPNVIDRTMAIRDLKLIADRAPQAIKVTPDDGLHHDASLVHVEISNVAGRSLILFNIASDGTVEMLYPVGADPHVVQTPDYAFPVRVRKPFGSDQLVAITSQMPMPALEQALHGVDKHKAAVQMINMLKRTAPEDARIGSAGLFTAP